MGSQDIADRCACGVPGAGGIGRRPGSASPPRREPRRLGATRSTMLRLGRVESVQRVALHSIPRTGVEHPVWGIECKCDLSEVRLPSCSPCRTLREVVEKPSDEPDTRPLPRGLSGRIHAALGCHAPASGEPARHRERFACKRDGTRRASLSAARDPKAMPRDGGGLKPDWGRCSMPPGGLTRIHGLCSHAPARVPPRRRA